MNSDFVLAVHALVFLNHKKTVLTSEALAENICTNPARVRRVMAKLRKAKLVEIRGWREEGGYFFPHPPEQVTLHMVADALDACFVSTGWRSGEPHMECRVASGISNVIDGIFEDLNKLCTEHLDQVTVHNIDLELFNPAKEKKHEKI